MLAVLELDETDPAQAPASAASGETTGPERVTLTMSILPAHNEAIEQYLRENGATITSSVTETYTRDGVTSSIVIVEASVPVAIIPALSNREGFRYAFTDYRHFSKLSFDLSNLVMLYEAGEMTPEDAANHSGAQWSGELLTLEVFVESCDTVPSLVAFRHRTFGHNPWWYDPDAPCQGSSLEDFGFVSLSVNSSDLRELSLLSGVTEVRGEIQPPTPQTSLTRPSGAATAGLVSGQRAANAPAAHKSDQWAQDGDGVKVGIIDGGYQGFAALMGNQVPSAANVQSWCWDSMMVAAVHDAKRSHVKHARRSFGAI